MLEAGRAVEAISHLELRGQDVLRTYEPDASLLSGAYKMPPVQKVT